MKIFRKLLFVVLWAIAPILFAFYGDFADWRGQFDMSLFIIGMFSVVAISGIFVSGVYMIFLHDKLRTAEEKRMDEIQAERDRKFFIEAAEAWENHVQEKKRRGDNGCGCLTLIAAAIFGGLFF